MSTDSMIQILITILGVIVSTNLISLALSRMGYPRAAKFLDGVFPLALRAIVAAVQSPTPLQAAIDQVRGDLAAEEERAKALHAEFTEGLITWEDTTESTRSAWRRVARKALAFLPLALLCLVGCGPSQGQVDRGIGTLSGFVSAVDQPLRDAYEREQRSCLTLEDPKPCVETVRQAWAPIVEGLQQVRAVWCEIDPGVCK